MRASQALLPGQTFDPQALLAPEQAIVAYRARVALAPPGSEKVALEAAFGRILARDARADADYPAHPRSTMDGFAIRSADGGAPRRITGEVRMGEGPPHGVGAGEALRITTGGAVPDGADAVIPIEDVDEAGGEITVRTVPAAGDAITPKGEDMRAGDLVIEAGRRIDGPALGVLATLGITQVEVWRRPVIAIVSTGDELVDPGSKPGPGQVRDSNRHALAGAILALGAEPLQIPRATDETGALERAIRQALDSADAVVLSGGSSVGPRDLVPRTVDALGEPGVVVHGLRVRPGKPTVLAAIGSTPILGLPGNPTSALMIFRTIAVPVLMGLTGEKLRSTPRPLARAGAAIAGRPGWTFFVPVRIEVAGVERVVTPFAIRSSHTSLLARADGFVVCPEDRPRIEPGETVEVHVFDGAALSAV